MNAVLNLVEPLSGHCVAKIKNPLCPKHCLQVDRKSCWCQIPALEAWACAKGKILIFGLKRNVFLLLSLPCASFALLSPFFVLLGIHEANHFRGKSCEKGEDW